MPALPLRDRTMPPSIPPATRFHPKPSLRMRELEGEAVLLDLATGRYFGLNASGCCVWSKLADSRSLDEIASELAEERELPRERLLADVIEIVAELEREGLVLRVE